MNEVPLRVLFLLSFSPHPEAMHGGRAITQLISRIAERHRVGVVYLRASDEPSPDPDFSERCELVEEVPRPEEEPRRFSRVGAEGRRVRSLLGGMPMLAAHSASDAYEQRVREVVERWRPDIVQAELQEMAQYLPAVDSKAARIVTVHDPGATAARERSELARGAKRALHRLDVLAWQKFERETFAHADAAVVLTERDRALYAGRKLSLRLVQIPLGIDLPERPLDPLGSSPESLVFVGGYRHRPNSDAAMRLLRSIFPAVRDRRPEVTLFVVGDAPTDEMRRLAGDHVVLTGRVESVTPFLDRAAIVTVPIRIGGGMRVKLLESLAAGTAVVASKLAAEGLALADGEQILLAESDDEFVAAIERLLADPDLRVSVARGAREWACAHLGWEASVEAYDRLYRSLVEA